MRNSGTDRKAMKAKVLGNFVGKGDGFQLGCSSKLAKDEFWTLPQVMVLVEKANDNQP